MKKFFAAVSLLAFFITADELNQTNIHKSAHRLLEKIHLNPIKLKKNPYKENIPKPQSHSNEVCAVVYKDYDWKTYKTKTFANAQQAKENNAHITHFGACGTCSSAQDLHVYLTKVDLTTEGRKCALYSFFKPLSVSCFREIGFSKPCAKMWYYNAKHTRKKCFYVCLRAMVNNEPHNLPDGSLSECLQCDKDNSEEIFIEYAGRTRRNSGLVSEIVRGSEEIIPLEHNYY